MPRSRFLDLHRLTTATARLADEGFAPTTLALSPLLCTLLCDDNMHLGEHRLIVEHLRPSLRGPSTGQARLQNRIDETSCPVDLAIDGAELRIEGMPPALAAVCHEFAQYILCLSSLQEDPLGLAVAQAAASLALAENATLEPVAFVQCGDLARVCVKLSGRHVMSSARPTSLALLFDAFSTEVLPLGKHAKDLGNEADWLDAHRRYKDALVAHLVGVMHSLGLPPKVTIQ